MWEVYYKMSSGVLPAHRFLYSKEKRNEGNKTGNNPEENKKKRSLRGRGIPVCDKIR